MNTIRNYLETMFANLPNTPEVLKAKDELWQMMEDKYSELIAEGKTENEAVGTVIAEFGNLEELADDLGLNKVLHPERTSIPNGPTYTEETVSISRREVRFDEVKAYLKDRANNALLVGLGVYLCVSCACPVILSQGFFGRYRFGDAAGILGVTCLIFMVVVAIMLFIISGTRMSKWDFLKKEPCSIDYATADYLKNEKERSGGTSILLLTIGVLLCAICWVPIALGSSISNNLLGAGSTSVLVSLLLEMVGVGILLMIYSSMITDRYNTLLNLNDQTTVSGTYKNKEDEPVTYSDPALGRFMNSYWYIVTCIYLIISFTTFAWGSTWIIWILAVVVKKIIETSFGGTNE